MGFDQLVSCRPEQIAQNPSIIFVVLDHQDSLRHGAPTCRSTWMGSVNENEEPWPNSDSTQMNPPCISMMRLDIARPRPVPPFLRVAEFSACWNSSNILDCSASAIPGPVSLTAIVNEPPSSLAVILISPASVNLSALPTRFSSTWESRRSSPWAGGSPCGISSVSARLLLV